MLPGKPGVWVSLPTGARWLAYLLTSILSDWDLKELLRQDTDTQWVV